MSEPKLISPLLDGFVMGDPISSHNGVRCCPAMQTDSDSKYIVKIISVPASQTKLDALLLAGAFSDSASARSYFKDLTDGIVEEAVLLQRLSRLEGFVPYESWQVLPMEDGEVGFDIYLIGTYRPTLERLLRREPMTHLSAVNLGLDLCSALAVCRRSGYLYVDLKPENVVICQDREYRIGDLGFIPLASLAYASLPERYISAYTPPEIMDAYSALNTTMDVYATGLILYQIYNGGTLPFEGRAPSQPLSAPQYADPEIARIILKACDPNPEVRWQDPLQMGQALVNYLQSNSINDTPILAQPDAVMPEILQEPPQEQHDAEPSTDEILAEVDQALDAVGDAIDETQAEATQANGGSDPATERLEETEPEESETISAADPVSEKAAAQMEEVPAETEDPDREERQASVKKDSETVSEEAELDTDLTELSSEAASLQQEFGVSEEVSQILAQADDLIAHETPEGVVVPEPSQIPISEPISVLDESETVVESTEETPEEAPQEQSPVSEEAADVPSDTEYEPDEEPVKKTKKHRKGWIALVICLALLAALAFGGYYYYQNFYLQAIRGISLSGAEDLLTVRLDTQIADELLTVHCTDTYGNTVKKSVENGTASFRDLNSATSYKISVSISGFHELVGVTSGVYVTPEQTSIESFTAVTGAEDGSVILSFTVQGPEGGGWNIRYAAEGEEEKTVTFTGHMTAISGLTIGKEYTFRLEPATALYLVGTDTVRFTASKIVYAEELTILGFHNKALTAVWNAPNGAAVESWTVRCYNDKGYDKTITVTDTKAVFEDLDVSSAYTVEVNAAGMTQGTRAFVSSNSVTIGELLFDSSDRNQLAVSWDFEGTTPAGGWLLLYSVDGSQEQLVVKCETNSGVIAPVIPGSRYDVTVQPANGSTVFGGTGFYEAPAAQTFSGYLLTAADMYFQMCKTPENPEWGRYDIPAENYKTTFSSGENISFAVYLNHEYNTSSDQIVTLFVIRDAEGKVVSTATQSRTWTSMWYRGFGRINVPSIPTAAGSYTLDIYFNGAIVTTQSFSIV